ncbi:MAG: ISAs1 family transposase [Mariprofundaceae bacterium]|nr:ISAs1 family transposase [Mariprofundaceae bacterium]
MVYQGVITENGILSHDTFGYVFSVIDIEEFSRCISHWVTYLCELNGDEIISIDGKYLRRSMDTASNKAAIYMVSAWSSSNQLVLGQQRVDDKPNEITAIPKLLMQLDITGALVTLDAMVCQSKVANDIIERNADYMLTLK